MLTQLQLDDIRSYISWTPPSDSDLENMNAEILSTPNLPIPTDATGAPLPVTVVWKVVRYFLRQKRSQLLATPSTFSLSGEYSQSTTGNIAILDTMLKEVDAFVAREEAGDPEPDAGAFHTGQVVRDGTWRTEANVRESRTMGLDSPLVAPWAR